MDDFGNIIFVIIIVIAVVSNIAKTVKKAKGVQKTPVFQEVEQNYFPSAEIRQPISSPKKKKEKKSVVTAVQEKIFDEEEDSAEVGEYNLSDFSEARKAVIYSEIFNRKY